MPTSIQIDAIIAKHFPAPAQPSDSLDDLVEWECKQARKVVNDVLTLTLNEAAVIKTPLD
jgi:hypothetical protein